MYDTPKSCPYTLELLHAGREASTYLIREHDEHGEYPNIFAKLYHDEASQEPIAIILSDTGTGLNVTNTSKHSEQNDNYKSSEPTKWNIASLLETTLNKHHLAPYFIITTHCHYDHICGIQHLQEAGANVTVLSSSKDKSYLTPWENLQLHSICKAIGLTAPKYPINWLNDGSKLSFTTRNGTQRESSITIIHTPGHTPDSLSWYDAETNTLCVGDTFYERESKQTKSGSNGKWEREPPIPVIFVKDSNIKVWKESMTKLLGFVRSKNVEYEDEYECEYEYNRDMETHNQSRLPFFSSSRSSRLPTHRQTGQGDTLLYTATSEPLLPNDDSDAEEWTVINPYPCPLSSSQSQLQSQPQPKRITLCAAHVTITTDAEKALTSMMDFMDRIQRGFVPHRKEGDLGGGDEMWFWDDDLKQSRDGGGGGGGGGGGEECDEEDMDGKGEDGYRFSVEGPKSVVLGLGG